MIFFTMVGLLLASGFLIWIALMCAFGVAFWNMGGNGSRGEVLCQVFGLCLALYGLYFIWHRYAPLSLVVSS